MHLSDLEHGGYAGRRATFIVGLDASRFPGSGGGDALLVDDDRRRLTAGQQTPALPTAAERIEERRHAFASLVARLRGRVTFSYATWDAVEGRGVAPASELLQAYRLLSGDASADYEALHAAVAPVASAVPRGSALLDSDDVWLNALSHNGALRRGVRTVCDVYPHLRAGVHAWKTRLRSDIATPHHGAIMPRPSLDPRNNVLRVVSATQLQMLGACPHQYLLRHVLGAKKPDDPQLSPEQWLPPMQKGALMHSVYERALNTVLRDNVAIAVDTFESIVLRILDEEIESMRAQLPPPGGAVFAAECEALREDARAFIAMVREDGPRFIELERKFGHADDPVSITLPDGSRLNLRGAIDRIDKLEDGRLVIIDYKTGSNLRYGGRSGVFDGGRRLQHVLYAEAAKRLFDADVASAEYHFPSRRSENHRARYTPADLRDGLGLVTDLLDMVANGWFIPTNQSDDCRFCDFATVCRVKVDGYGKVDSALADWSREAGGDPVDLLRRIRR
jgi:ATP-dependent helicase/nuclease subunit B